jgi:hypothetical protein
MAWDHEKIMRSLQESMTVMDAIQSRQAARVKEHQEWLEGLTTHQMNHEIWLDNMRKDDEASKKRMAHIEETLLEIGDKLNGLIGYMDNQHQPPTN